MGDYSVVEVHRFLTVVAPLAVSTGSRVLGPGPFLRDCAEGEKLYMTAFPNSPPRPRCPDADRADEGAPNLVGPSLAPNV